jgi:putative ubiquitin-RnfH superfamily antitoxin RatB of RatAB toxin-antitoxin module
MGLAEPNTIEVEVAFSLRAGDVQRATLVLPAGATLAQALERTGWALPQGLKIGVWGRQREPGDVLRDGDRVELYRGLTVDPKEARRKRYRSRRANAQTTAAADKAAKPTA